MTNCPLDPVQCYRFSDVARAAQTKCCDNMSLQSALEYNLKCLTCQLHKDVPQNTIPIFPANSLADIHLLNNHLIVCVICTVHAFRQVWGKENVNKHVMDCIIRVTNNTPRPYICTNCLQTIWLRPQQHQ